MYESFGFRTAGVRRRYYHDNNEDALIMWRTDGRGAMLESSEPPGAPILGDRDLVRRHLCGGRHARGEILSNVISSQARFHERYGGVVPEVASRHHLELVNAVVDEALERGRHRPAATRARSPPPAGPGLIGALLVGLSTAKALAAAAQAAVRRPWTTCTGTSRRTSSSPDPLEPPFLCLIASGGHTLLATRRATATATSCSARPATTRPARRSTRRARLMGLGYPGRRRDRPAGARGRPGAFDFPVGMRRGDSLDFSFSGLKTALVYKVRDLGPEQHAGPARRPGRIVPAGRGRVADGQAGAGPRLGPAHRRLAIGGGVAANSAAARRVDADCAERAGSS